MNREKVPIKIKLRSKYVGEGDLPIRDLDEGKILNKGKIGLNYDGNIDERKKSSKKIEAGKLKSSKRKKKTFKRKLAKFLVLVIVATSVFWLLTTRLGKLSVQGSKRYTSETVKKRLVTSSIYDNSVILVLRSMLGYKMPVLPYIQEMKIKLNGIYDVKVDMIEKNIAYQLVSGEEFYDLDLNLKVEGKTKTRRENTVLLTGYSIKEAQYPFSLPIEKTNKESLEKVVKGVKNIEGLKLKSLDVKNEQLTINVGNISVKLGDEVYLEEKLSIFRDIYPKISDLKGVLHLENYKSGQKDYRFENKG